MKKLLLLLLLALFSCDSNPMGMVEPIEIKIQPNLPQDANGYYHLELIRSPAQTLHTIMLETNMAGESKRIEWCADETWLLNYYGFEFDVPIINGVSYTDVEDGGTRTIFAPVIEMLGDTVNVVATTRQAKDEVYIILY